MMKAMGCTRADDSASSVAATLRPVIVLPARARQILPAAGWTLALAVVVLASAGCKRGEASLGQACKADGDCATGLLCHEAQCLQQGNVELMRKAASQPSGDRAGDAPARKVGDRIDVEWKGAWKPATIIGIVASGSYRVHYEGHDASWDEVIGEGRIKGGARKRRDGTASARPGDSASATP
jgi:hypothetical protein